MNHRQLFVTLVAIVCLGRPAIANTIVLNGGFETGDLTGWSKSGSSSEMRFDSVNNRAHSGAYGLYLGAGALVTVSQTLTTIAGGEYVLDYWLLNQGGTPNYFAANWDGSDVPGSVLTNADAQGFTEYTFTLTAIGTSTVLGFSSYQLPNSWSVDDVSVVEVVPEPGTFIPLTTGFALIWTRRRSTHSGKRRSVS